MSEDQSYVLVIITRAGHLLLVRLSFEEEGAAMMEMVRGLEELITRVTGNDKESGTTRDLVIDQARWADLTSSWLQPTFFLKN